MVSLEESSTIIAERNSATLNSYCIVAVTSLFLYDFILTIGDEVEYFWINRRTGAAVLLYLNKYLNFLVYIYDIPVEFVVVRSNERCVAMIISNHIISLLPYLVWAAFSALRTFALSSNRYRWTLSLLVFALSLVPFAINMATFAYGFTATVFSTFGCMALRQNISRTISRRLSIASRTCLLAADCIVVGTTWLALFNGRINFRHMHRHNTFANVLLIDGTIYFLILLILNSLHLIFSLIYIDVPAFWRVSSIILFTDPYVLTLSQPHICSRYLFKDHARLTAILVQRFMLHLQSVEHKKALGLTTSLEIKETSRTSSVVFDRMISSLPEEYWKGDDEEIPNGALSQTIEEGPKPITDYSDDGQLPVASSSEQHVV